MPTKFQLITELYDQTVQSVTGSYQSWTGFLRAACYNYKCPFDDQILIYAQRPDATAVLEMERWNRQFGRWVNRGAKSIAVFGDDGQNCLKLYFDVSDTHASRFARPLPIWTMHPAFEPEVIETLEATFGNLAEKENLADAVRSACHNAVADNFTDYLQDLRECREDSLLEELDDLNLEVFYRDALEVSVAYMLMTRLGLRADDYFTADEFAHVYEFNTPPTINALGIATSDIAEMGLRAISRTVMQAQRDQFFANREKTVMMTAQNNTKHPMKGANSMEVTYRMQNGFQVPNLLMPQTPEVHLGKYAELRRAYLKKHRRVLYTNLKTSGALTEHLSEIEQSAQKMVEQTVARMARAEGVTEELKATDPLRWTGLMNNLRHSAEELVLSDLIYA